MDFTPIIQSLFQLWYLIPLFILIVVIKSPWFKGVWGEFVINLSIQLRLDKDKYHLIKNVTLPSNNGTTQIDHIIVSVYGVFVVETKNMKGWIFGKEKESYWTQQIYKHRNSFQNPLRQNYKHVKTLLNLLELAEEHVHSLVVFIGESTFKSEMPENVTYGSGYLRFIESKTTPVLSEIEVQSIVRKIESGRLTPSFKTHRNHVNHVKEIVSEKTTDPSCPKCGSVMIVRVVKKGPSKGTQFWGCTKYPRCRGTAPID